MSIANTKGNKVRIEWDANHIGFNAGSMHETFRRIKTEEAAFKLVNKRNKAAMKNAVWFKQTSTGVETVNLLGFPSVS